MSVKNLNGYTSEIKLGEEANRYKIEDIMNFCERVNY